MSTSVASVFFDSLSLLLRLFFLLKHKDRDSYTHVVKCVAIWWHSTAVIIYSPIISVCRERVGKLQATGSRLETGAWLRDQTRAHLSKIIVSF